MRVLWLLCLLAVPSAASHCPPSSLTPDQVQARFGQLSDHARASFQQGDFAKAADDFRQAVCLAPASADAWHGLGIAEAAAGRFARAYEALESASRLAPRDFTILLARAQVEISLGRFALVRRTLFEAAQIEPPGARAAGIHAQLARTLFQQKQSDLALAELLRAGQAGGAGPDAVFLQARLENTLGAFPDAVRDASRLEQEPSLSDSVRAAAAAVAGLACRNLLQPDNAMRHLRLAVQLGPSDLGVILESAYLVLSEIYAEKQDPLAARQVLEQGHKALPDSPKLALALGRTLAEAGDPAAVPVLKQVSAKFPAELDAYKWLAQAHASLGETKLATATLLDLARLRPGYPMIGVMIAQSVLRQDPPDYPQALAYLALAEKFSPADPDIYYLRGKICISLGRYPDAIAPLRRAIALVPNMANTYYLLGIAYQKLGQHALAQQQFERMSYLKTAANSPELSPSNR
ncbi:MAG TPA: tetratricopeptide repeat protein [Bryobacterales bacterium]|nr:tetratricopeptide repeat protein [Bryobacterales bacterium]